MFLSMLDQHLEYMGRLQKTAPVIEAAGEQLASAISRQHKILVCGNGGSAADAQHFAAELIGRFEKERDAWPAIALTTDTSILTAIGNDYGFADVFSRQVQGLGSSGDMLIAISTSGNSENVLSAVVSAKKRGLHTIGLLGVDGGRLKHEVHQAIVIEGRRTARIQEAHIFILHYWAQVIEESMGINQ